MAPQKKKGGAAVTPPPLIHRKKKVVLTSAQIFGAVAMVIVLIGVYLAFIGEEDIDRQTVTPPTVARSLSDRSSQQHLNVTALHKYNNVKTKENWDYFTHHRGKVTEMLTTLSPLTRLSSIAALSPITNQKQNATVAIIGFGNGNDVDLTSVANAYTKIYLLDIDNDAMQNGVSRQNQSNNIKNDQLFTHAVDITGIAHMVSEWKNMKSIAKAAPKAWNVNSEFDLQGTFPTDWPQQFDVVVSSTLLTQLVIAVINSTPKGVAGSEHANYLMIAVRDKHLVQLVDMTVKGGTGIIITDIVSTTTQPQLSTMSDSQIDQTYLDLLFKKRDFFTACHPQLLIKSLKTNKLVQDRISNIRQLPAWKWRIGRNGYYAVVAITFEKL